MRNSKWFWGKRVTNPDFPFTMLSLMGNRLKCLSTMGFDQISSEIRSPLSTSVRRNIFTIIGFDHKTNQPKQIDILLLIYYFIFNNFSHDSQRSRSCQKPCQHCFNMIFTRMCCLAIVSLSWDKSDSQASIYSYLETLWQ